jgi:hypothetical protein
MKEDFVFSLRIRSIFNESKRNELKKIKLKRKSNARAQIQIVYEFK